ncbi:MAG: hypothetical protein EXR62_12335 [Chloroflexi bacterium]|nr:hypothetical protein [Chloroflexota bacterium]
MPPTTQQQQAVSIEDRPLLVDAGAGTGKTWVLVERFLTLLNRHPDWSIDAIIAVTFTEKAAREMRSRIRQGIEARAQQAPITGEGTHWHRRRRDLDRLQVGTIHALCARILRENAIAAAIDPRFTMLDEQEADLLQEEALRQALAALVDSLSLSELLDSMRVNDLREELLTLLNHRGTVHHLFSQLPPTAALLDRWRDEVALMHREVWDNLLESLPGLQEALDCLPATVISDTTDKLAPAVLAAQAGCQTAAVYDLSGAFTHFNQIKRGGGKQTNWGGKEVLEELKSMLGILQEAGKSLEKAGCHKQIGPEDERAAAALHHWYAVWQQVDASYTGLKEERHALDFDNLELKAEALFGQQPRDPRLTAFLAGIRHLMVDEFQDTSRTEFGAATQQRIIYALAHPADGGRLFVAGDAKQSIYRFRQAQISVFHRTAQDIAAAGGQPALLLNTSFRTHDRLLTALNGAFEQIFQPSGTAYTDFEAHPGPLTADRLSPPLHPLAPAPVELWLLPEKGEDDRRIHAEEARLWEARLLAERLWEARLLAERLLALQANNYPVWDKAQRLYRPFRFSDAAILFRATTSLPLYEEQFKAAGLPYLTISGRGYFDRPEIQDLIALLACLYNPADDLSLATVLRSPLFSLSDETLYRLRWQRPANTQEEPAARLSATPIPLMPALQAPPATSQPEQVSFAAAILAELSSLAGKVNVWQLLRTALDRTGYEAVLVLSDSQGGSQRVAGRQRSNIQKFLEMARDRGGASLSEFLGKVQDLRAREAREGEALAGAPPDAGAVQLMSVHAAKGLEFPVVVVANLGRGSRGGSNVLPRILHDPAFGLVCKSRDTQGDWQEPASYLWAKWLTNRMEAAESKRLFYIACTRTADLLLLSGQVGEKSSWLADILAAWEIDPTASDNGIRTHDDFTLRVCRPVAPPAEDKPAAALAPSTQAGLLQMPPLAEPLPLAHRPPGTVSPLLRTLPTLRPAVERDEFSAASSTRTGTDSTLDRLARRVLADWKCLALPPQKLEPRLAVYAHAADIFAPDAEQRAVAAVRRMISSLHHTPLYREITQAALRYHDLPFTLETPAGLLRGAIDLLYRDTAGDWRLVAWSTAWRPAAEREAALHDHLPELALAAQVVSQTLGIRPQVSLCFLRAEALLVEVPPEDLERAWEEMSGTPLEKETHRGS